MAASMKIAAFWNIAPNEAAWCYTAEGCNLEIMIVIINVRIEQTEPKNLFLQSYNIACNNVFYATFAFSLMVQFSVDRFNCNQQFT
jgi:hypothetical protein